MKWFEQPLVAIDLETTGVDPKTARIWEIGAATQSPDPNVIDAAQHNLINPDCDIPPEVIKLCNLTPEELDKIYWDAPDFKSIAASVCALLAGGKNGAITVGYNILDYDWPLLEAEFQRLGQTLQPNRFIIDVLVLVRYLEPRLKSHKLADVAAHYRARAVTGAHRAIADCYMTLDILDAIQDQLPIELEDLLSLQGEAKVKQDLNFEKYGYWLATTDWTAGNRLFIACGKHRGTLLKDVDPRYLQWVLNNNDIQLTPATRQAFETATRRTA